MCNNFFTDRSKVALRQSPFCRSRPVSVRKKKKKAISIARVELELTLFLFPTRLTANIPVTMTNRMIFLAGLLLLTLVLSAPGYYGTSCNSESCDQSYDIKATENASPRSGIISNQGASANTGPIKVHDHLEVSYGEQDRFASALSGLPLTQDIYPCAFRMLTRKKLNTKPVVALGWVSKETMLCHSVNPKPKDNTMQAFYPITSCVFYLIRNQTLQQSNKWDNRTTFSPDSNHGYKVNKRRDIFHVLYQANPNDFVIGFAYRDKRETKGHFNYKGKHLEVDLNTTLHYVIGSFHGG
ncbi:uncharacterized protein LOC135400781 [Ornithodoros turicata]|uniref:uncharacterized protein LOC135400781 n=1 Tax=Ornithodoros turicata TaxID=34597 RepID=UPI003138B9E4